MELYLAHPYGSREKVREWELKFEEATGIALLNPFYDMPNKFMLEADRESMQKATAEHYQEIVEKDIEAITNSDGVLAVVDGNPSIGAIMEIVYGHISYNPVYIIAVNGCENHIWVIYHADKLFTSFEECQKYFVDYGGKGGVYHVCHEVAGRQVRRPGRYSRSIERNVNNGHRKKGNSGHRNKGGARGCRRTSRSGGKTGAASTSEFPSYLFY